MDDPLPTPLPPPPPTVRATRGQGYARVAILPFVLIGVASLLALPVRLGVRLMGRPIQATIDGLDRHVTRDGRHPSYVARFHYTLDGREWADTQSVSADEFGRLHVGDRVPGRAAVLFGHPLALTAAGSVNAMTGLLVVAVVGFDAAVALLVYGSWIVPARARRLLETGTAVAGEVMAEMPFHARSGYRVRVAYRYPTPDGDEGGNLTVNGRPGDATAVGRPVTVVYDPARPAHSTVVEFGGYTISG